MIGLILVLAASFVSCSLRYFNSKVHLLAYLAVASLIRWLSLDYRTELCRFSGQKIYPGRGIRFIRSDSQVSSFMNLL